MLQLLDKHKKELAREVLEIIRHGEDDTIIQANIAACMTSFDVLLLQGIRLERNNRGNFLAAVQEVYDMGIDLTDLFTRNPEWLDISDRQTKADTVAQLLSGRMIKE